MFTNKTYIVITLFVYYIICLRLFIECKKTLSTKNQTVGLVLRKNLKWPSFSLLQINDLYDHYIILNNLLITFNMQSITVCFAEASPL